MSRSHRRGERGFAAIELSTGVAVLVLPVVLLVAGLPRWADRQALARVAARDAARVVVLRGWCDRDAAGRAVTAVATGGGLDASRLRLSLDCSPSEPLSRGATVTARVTVTFPALAVPLIGTVGQWDWTAAHREPVDPYGSRP